MALEILSWLDWSVKSRHLSIRLRLFSPTLRTLLFCGKRNPKVCDQPSRLTTPSCVEHFEVLEVTKSKLKVMHLWFVSKISLQRCCGASLFNCNYWKPIGLLVF